MAITPVKTGNVNAPAKTTDTKLVTQFNAAAKSGATGPSTSTPPPFYTPAEGSFKEVRKLNGKGYNARLNWQINENQQAGSNKVFIRGSVTVDWGNDSTNYVIDGNNSYIDSTGQVFYKVPQFGETYKTGFNLFKKIEKDVRSTLDQVKKNTEFALDKNGKATPVSLDSGKLSLALNAVGEYNLLRGVGLNGAGKRIKNLLAAELAKKDASPEKLRIRQAIALAMTASGVKVNIPNNKTQAASEQIKIQRENRMTHAEIAQMRVEDGIATTINQIRERMSDRTGNTRLNQEQRAALVVEVVRHFDNRNNRLPVAAAYAMEFARPGVVTPWALTANARQSLVIPILQHLEGNTAPLNDLLGQWNIPPANIEALTDLLGFENPFLVDNIGNMVNRYFAPLVDTNATLAEQVDDTDDRNIWIRRAFVALGEQMRDVNFGSEL